MRAQIICFGNDALLLETRRLILGRQFDAYAANGLRELAAMLERHRFDLIVLCQTLSYDESEKAILHLRQNSPQAKVLTMLRASQRPLDLVAENRFDPNEGPKALLDRIGNLLCGFASVQASVL